MTAAEARALTNAANQKEFDHEGQLAQIMTGIETIANKGEESAIATEISKVNITALKELGFKISLNEEGTTAFIKW